MSDARKKLEGFFAAERELEQSYAQGHTSHIHYLIKKQHLRDQLVEHAPVADHALRFVEDYLHHWSLLSFEERRVKERTQRVAAQRLTPWYAALKGLNLERMTLGILDALAEPEVPPVPAATEAEVNSYIRSHGFIQEATGRRAAWICGSIVESTEPPEQK